MTTIKNYTDDELLNLRKIQMDMYREVKRICEKHGIQYVAVGGSALGAIRHNGYIPWDDDLDIAMMREDYECFLKYAKEEIDSKYFVQNFYTDPHYGNYFTKIRCNGTLFVQNIDKRDDSHHGIFIDIFPIDRLTENVKLRKKYRKQLMLFFQLYMAKCNGGISGETSSFSGKVKHFIRATLHVLLMLVPKKRLFDKVDTLCKKFNAEKTNTVMISVVYAMAGWRYVSEDVIFPPVEHIFEKETILIPHNSEQYLSSIYGNYMELPPVEKRINHRPIELDFGIEVQ